MNRRNKHQPNSLEEKKPKSTIPLSLLVCAFSLLIAGCASQSPAPALTPPTQAVSLPPDLTADQMDKLRQAAPETCFRVQADQPLTLGDIKAMTAIGLSPEVIIAQVRRARTVYHLTANAILDLNKSGVSNQVVDFLLSTPTTIAGSMPVPEPSINASPVQTPPPSPPVEVQPPAPGPDYAWVDGDWVWNDGWVWVSGHWDLPPFPGGLWFHGGWRRHWDGFHRERGHWRR